MAMAMAMVLLLLFFVALYVCALLPCLCCCRVHA